MSNRVSINTAEDFKEILAKHGGFLVFDLATWADGPAGPPSFFSLAKTFPDVLFVQPNMTERTSQAKPVFVFYCKHEQVGCLYHNPGTPLRSELGLGVSPKRLIAARLQPTLEDKLLKLVSDKTLLIDNNNKKERVVEAAQAAKATLGKGANKLMQRMSSIRGSKSGGEGDDNNPASFYRVDSSSKRDSFPKLSSSSSSSSGGVRYNTDLFNDSKSSVSLHLPSLDFSDKSDTNNNFLDPVEIGTPTNARRSSSTHTLAASSSFPSLSTPTNVSSSSSSSFALSPSQGNNPGSYLPPIKMTTWMCFFCKLSNLATSTECIRCGNSGEESAKAMLALKQAKSKAASKRDLSSSARDLSSSRRTIRRAAEEMGEWQCYFCLSINYPLSSSSFAAAAASASSSITTTTANIIDLSFSDSAVSISPSHAISYSPTSAIASSSSSFVPSSTSPQEITFSSDDIASLSLALQSPPTSPSPSHSRQQQQQSNYSYQQTNKCILCGKKRALYAVQAEEWQQQDSEKVLERLVDCELHTLVGQWPGVLTISNTHITFAACETEMVDLQVFLGENSGRGSKQENKQPQIIAQNSFRHKLQDLSLVLPRRYLLRDTAIEIFVRSSSGNSSNISEQRRESSQHLINFYPTTEHTAEIANVFFEALGSAFHFKQTKKKAIEIANGNSGSKKKYQPESLLKPTNAHQVRKTVLTLLCHLLHTPVYLSGAKWLSNSSITQQWQQHEMSNFDYLLFLNQLAGRSFNDTTQYPVMPWVLRDFTSHVLDLEDPNSFRNLSLPIGALNDKRWRTIQERFENWEDNSLPPFHYGSHYSSSAIVLYYLIREEPFSGLALSLQGGNFDLPDRLFHSIEGTWNLCNEHMADFKELIPEFFTGDGSFLLNSQHLSLGKRKTDDVLVDDVILPPWAHSAQHFIEMNRKALESPFVSANLHSWIDLVFGQNQTGKRAVEAKNVFCHLTYAGSVDLDSIVDPCDRKATEDQINHFGQTPEQLLQSPHPRRFLAPKSPSYSAFTPASERDVR